MRPLELATKSKIQTSDDPLEQKQLVTYEVWTLNARFRGQKTANFVNFVLTFKEVEFMTKTSSYICIQDKFDHLLCLCIKSGTT